jgi:hypothetical protein
MWFTPKEMSTVCWNEWDPLVYVYQLLAIPFITAEIVALPVLNMKGFSPKERANELELQMANSLGCKALRKTNKSLFRKGLPDALVRVKSSNTEDVGSRRSPKDLGRD